VEEISEERFYAGVRVWAQEPDRDGKSFRIRFGVLAVASSSILERQNDTTTNDNIIIYTLIIILFGRDVKIPVVGVDLDLIYFSSSKDVSVYLVR